MDRQSGDNRHGGGLEALIAESVAEKIERRAGAIEEALLFIAMRLSQPFANPGRAPLQLPQRVSAVVRTTAAQRHRNSALQFGAEHDRDRHM